jgi:hypothetical protein
LSPATLPPPYSSDPGQDITADQVPPGKEKQGRLEPDDGLSPRPAICFQMRQKPLNIPGAKIPGMNLFIEEVNIAENPLATGDLCTVGIMKTTECFLHLIHKPVFWIGPKFLLVFHIVSDTILINGFIQYRNYRGEIFST